MSARAIAWQRPEVEAKNTGLPKAGALIQDGVRVVIMDYEAKLKSFPRDEAQARAVGLEAFAPPGYRKVAAALGICARTAFNRMKRLRELGMGVFRPRFDQHGRPDGTTFFSRPWKAVLDDWKADPQIAKTPDGEIIYRNGFPLSVEDAERLGIKFIAVVEPKPARTRQPASKPPDLSNPITGVLIRYRVIDDGEGAAALLSQAREHVPDIAADDLAAALETELKERAERKRRKNQVLSINVPYVSTFIGHLARCWAAWRAQDRAEQAGRAEQATRAAERARHQAREIEYENFASEAMGEWMAKLPPADYAALIADASREIRRQWPAMTAAQIEDAARNVISHEWRAAAGIPSFAEWREAQPDGEPRAG